MKQIYLTSGERGGTVALALPLTAVKGRELQAAVSNFGKLSIDSSRLHRTR